MNNFNAIFDFMLVAENIFTIADMKGPNTDIKPPTSPKKLNNVYIDRSILIISFFALKFIVCKIFLPG